MLPISEINTQPRAAVTMALLKLAGSAFFNSKYSGRPIARNITEVMPRGMIPLKDA